MRGLRSLKRMASHSRPRMRSGAIACVSMVTGGLIFFGHGFRDRDAKNQVLPNPSGKEESNPTVLIGISEFFGSKSYPAKAPKRNCPREGSQAKGPKPNFPIERSQAKVIKRRCPREETQSKYPKQKFLIYSLKAKYPKRKFPSEKIKRKTPSESENAKVPKRKLPSEGSQANVPKRKILGVAWKRF